MRYMYKYALQKWQEASRMPPAALWCPSLYEVMRNHDHQRGARRTNTTQCHPLSGGLYLYLFKHHIFSQASDLAKHCIPFSRQLPERHFVFVLSKASSRVSALVKTSSHKSVSRTTLHGTTESAKKPEIPTSQNRHGDQGRIRVMKTQP